DPAAGDQRAGGADGRRSPGGAADRGTAPLRRPRAGRGPLRGVGALLTSGAGEAQPLTGEAVAPDVVAGPRHRLQPLLDGGEDAAGHPADVPVDQEVVPSVEEGEVGRALLGVGGRARLVAEGRV